MSLQEGLHSIIQEPANKPIITRFLRFAAAVAFVPIIVYQLVLRISYNFFASPAGLFSPPIVAGCAAVFSLNLLTAIFAILAVKERVLDVQSVPEHFLREEQDREENFEHCTTDFNVQREKME